MSNQYGFASTFKDSAALPKTFEHLVDAYIEDPLFPIPPAIRELGARSDLEIVLLGTSHFGKGFAVAAQGKMRIACAVDDIRHGKGERAFHGEIPLISSSELAQTCRERTGRVLAVNTCRSDIARRHFDLLCIEHHIPCINFEQAIRLWGLNDTVDHRMADWGRAIAGNAGDYVRVAQRLADRYSVDTLYSVLCFHLSCDMEWCWNIARPYASLYFRSGIFALDKSEKLVDCGASFGESASAFIDATSGQFDRIWMIEPDTFNIQALEKFIGRFKGMDLHGKFSLLPYAVGNATGEIPFEHMGGHLGSIMIGNGKANGMARLARLDDLIDDAPTLIKMDIEGAELPALEGARGLIGTHGPKLMISAYHRDDDFVRIPALVSTVRDDYKIGVRHHTGDRWDTCFYFYR